VWRDVAGMLRSFEYAAAVVARELEADGEDHTAQLAYRGAEWAERNQESFLRAYAGRGLTSDERVLVDAYCIDKAAYECLYESRNRPGWIDIPLTALARLAVEAPDTGSDAAQ